MNKDKASNYKFYSQNKEFSKIKIENEQLINLIHYSYEKYPRTYLFENKNIKPYTEKTILSMLRHITKIDKITINMMRSIFVTNFYKQNNINYNDKKKLSHQMRHSVETASINYNKILSQFSLIFVFCEILL